MVPSLFLKGQSTRTTCLPRELTILLNPLPQPFPRRLVQVAQLRILQLERPLGQFQVDWDRHCVRVGHDEKFSLSMQRVLVGPIRDVVFISLEWSYPAELVRLIGGRLRVQLPLVAA